MLKAIRWTLLAAQDEVVIPVHGAGKILGKWKPVTVDLVRLRNALHFGSGLHLFKYKKAGQPEN